MPVLDPAALEALAAFRRDLHRAPEVSGQEERTAAGVAAMLAQAGADRVLTGLGGHGVAGIFMGRGPGPRVLFRAELDALPIHESGTRPWRSAVAGQGHLCGHDGHMAFLAGLARLLRDRPVRGEVVLLFQPAEETGAGAAAVAADPRYAAIRPDYAFAIHNMPGLPLGRIALQAGPMACASRGMAVRLTGRTAHASEPEKGLSPDMALVTLIPALKEMGAGRVTDPGFRLVTVTHVRLGVPAFGIAPGEAELFATLRTTRDSDMAALVAQAEDAVTGAAQAAGLTHEITWRDVFAACANSGAAVRVVQDAARRAGIGAAEMTLPMRPSEDFGGLGDAGTELAMIFLGAGETCPPLHAPDYDFPDALIAPGIALFSAILAELGLETG